MFCSFEPNYTAALYLCRLKQYIITEICGIILSVSFIYLIGLDGVQSIQIHFYYESQQKRLNISKFDFLDDLREQQKVTVCSCHVTYAFRSESTLYKYLNIKELLAESRREV